jgi:electron transfer flavoprotein beta subunit
MGIHIIVCIKAVLLQAPAGQKASPAVRSIENVVLNPFDRSAVEAALGLKEKCQGTLTALTMGPESSVAALCEVMAMGADRAILATDRDMAGSDTLATSHVLAAAIKRLQPFDVVIFGPRTFDSDTGQIGPQTAAKLQIPQVTNVDEFLLADAADMRVSRTIDGYKETYTVEMPASFTIHSQSFPPRDLALPQLNAAFEEGPIERWNLSTLGIESSSVGEDGSPTRVISMSRIRKKRQCQFIEGTVEEQTEALVSHLVESGFVK